MKLRTVFIAVVLISIVYVTTCTWLRFDAISKPNLKKTPPYRQQLVLLWNYGKVPIWRPGVMKYMDDHERLNIYCNVTYNKNLMAQADVVVFHGTREGMRKMTKAEMKRLRLSAANATFVFYIREPPTMTRPFGKEFDNFFDVTATYRTDSEIYLPFGEANPLHYIDYVAATEPPAKRRRYTIIWIVSNCYTPSKREAYVKELSEFINVKVYGKCSPEKTYLVPYGNAKRNSAKLSRLNRAELYKRLLANSHFYLSFENSICNEYITEKFFYALDSPAVPVVMGPNRSQYEKIAPSKSFIHVDDFESPSHLAQYLRDVANDYERYLKYFEWKSKFVVEQTDVSYSFCKYFDGHHDTTRTDKYADFSRFWNENTCV